MQPRELMVVFLLVSLAGVFWVGKSKSPRAVPFQLAQSRAKAEKILGGFDSQGWRSIREAFLRDYLLILGYVGFFVMAGFGVSTSNRNLGWFMALAAIAVGILDVMENTFALRFLALEPCPRSEALLASMSMWSRLKWWALGPLALSMAWADWNYFPGVWKWLGGLAFCLSGLTFLASALFPVVLRFPAPLLLLMLGMLVHSIGVFRILD